MPEKPTEIWEAIDGGEDRSQHCENRAIQTGISSFQRRLWRPKSPPLTGIASILRETRRLLPALPPVLDSLSSGLLWWINETFHSFGIDESRRFKFATRWRTSRGCGENHGRNQRTFHCGKLGKETQFFLYTRFCDYFLKVTFLEFLLEN